MESFIIFMGILAIFSAFTISLSIAEIDNNFNTIDSTTTISPETYENIISDKFPEPYPAMNKNWTIHVENATGIEIVMNDLDLDPLKDYLRITFDESTDKDSDGFYFTGKIEKPLKIRLLQFIKITLNFVVTSTSEHTHKGFSLSYKPFGEIPITVTPSPTVPTVPTKDLKTITRFLNVEKEIQIDETWLRFKELLCNATNNFTTRTGLKLEECRTSNVTIVRILQCPSQWSGYENCIEITFAIQLFEFYNQTDGRLSAAQENFIGPYDDDVYPQELSVQNLEKMWSEYGGLLFEKEGFMDFEIPNAIPLIFMWIGISLGILLLFVFVLVIIWRLDVFHYNMPWQTQEDDNQNILKNQSDFDITMFPSPPQVVPALFPSGSTQQQISSGGYDSRSRVPLNDRTSNDGIRDFKRSFSDDYNDIPSGIEPYLRPYIFDGKNQEAESHT